MSYKKCAGFGFCACCNESVCTDNELNNSKSIEAFEVTINEKIENIQSREDKTTYTKDEVVQILKSYKKMYNAHTSKIEA
jgi:hypothetical protein